MTYNVHSCIGRNGRASPLNIAKVISTFNPDIIALQELDVGMKRSDNADQADEIAGALNMKFHFHPSIQMEKGKYGNAILSRLPMKLVQADALPILHEKFSLEKRGAIWVQVQYESHTIQVMNTHLGLNRKERLFQIDNLLSKKWLKHSACIPPIIFCADLNSMPRSEVYKKIRTSLVDTHEGSKGRYAHKTWPSRFPFMRIDYIFTSPDMSVKNILFPQSKLVLSASDHLPVFAEVESIPNRSDYEENP
jgi:endonuclease/exonuclease/phosphatase family metal-dependent hydrolase